MVCQNQSTITDMKIKKNGTLGLDKLDLRVGNFVVRLEPERVKFSDISMLAVHSISRRTAKGEVMTMLYDMAKKGDEDAKRLLQNYCAVMFNTILTVPFNTDQEDGFVYMNELQKLNEDCIRRGRAVYGVEENPSEEKEQKDIEAVKDAVKTEEEAKDE